MKQNAKKFGLRLAALILAVLLVGTAVLAPCLVSAEDGEGGRLIDDPGAITMEGSGGREPVAPSFSSPGADDILFEQLPYAPSPYWGALDSDIDLGSRMFEDFWGLSGYIGDIHWYGFSVICCYYDCDPMCYYDCDPTGMEFEIIFYQDDGGSPGEVVAKFPDVIPTITYYDTYSDPSSNYTAYRFEADLGTPVSLTEGWVSIQKTYSPNGCLFFWLISLAGNGYSVHEVDGDIGFYPMDFAFALTGGSPPVPNLKYLHSTRGLFNLTEPLGTQWHELWPFFCKEYHLSSWNDTSGDGVLSHCDWIDMYEKPNGELRDYHVEEVTITLNVTPKRGAVVFGVNGLPSPMFIELEGGYNASVLTNPVGTQWHEILPRFCREYHLSDWDDGPGNGVLDSWDLIELTNKDTQESTWWRVEEVAIDIIVTPEPPPVGGEAYPVNKMSLLAPWIAVGVVLAGGISWYVLRRRRARS